MDNNTRVFTGPTLLFKMLDGRPSPKVLVILKQGCIADVYLDSLKSLFSKDDRDLNSHSSVKVSSKPDTNQSERRIQIVKELKVHIQK